MAVSRDPFYSPKARLKRANKHLGRLKKRIDRFFKPNPCRQVVELDADGITQIHKLKFIKKPPESWTHSATEILEGLRSALDQIGYASAVAAGKVAPKKTQFPIGDDPVGLDNLINRKVSKDLPDEILALFCSFKPYKGGNDAIWALNKLANAKHTTLVPVAVSGAPSLIRNITISLGVSLLNPTYDSEKHEIPLARVPPGGHLQYNLQVSFLVGFGNVDFLGQQAAVDVLRTMAAEVERVLMATEAECRRLRFIK